MGTFCITACLQMQTHKLALDTIFVTGLDSPVVRLVNLQSDAYACGHDATSWANI